eukprot:scaffold22245_cov63-Phaeocystis_antarctica.AAC.3
MHPCLGTCAQTPRRRRMPRVPARSSSSASLPLSAPPSTRTSRRPEWRAGWWRSTTPTRARATSRPALVATGGR